MYFGLRSIKQRKKISLVLSLLLLIQTFAATGVVYASPIESDVETPVYEDSAFSTDEADDAVEGEIASGEDEEAASLTGLETSQFGNFIVNGHYDYYGSLDNAASLALDMGKGTGTVEMTKDQYISLIKQYFADFMRLSGADPKTMDAL